jgi:hypothetical protein
MVVLLSPFKGIMFRTIVGGENHDRVLLKTIALNCF